MHACARLLPSWLLASVALLGAGGSTAAAAPPATPLPPAVKLVDVELRRPAARVTWTPATPVDAVDVLLQHTHRGRTVERQAGRVASVTTPVLERGTTHRFALVAINGSGERSAPSAAVPVNVPRLRPRLAAGQAYLRGRSARCASPCTRGSLTGVQLRIAADPPLALAGAPIQIKLAYRAPGRPRARPAGQLFARIDADGRASVLLARTRLARGAGTWCMRAVIPGTSERTATSSAATCLRLRPPITIGWAGDIVLGSEWGHPPSNGAGVFTSVRHLLRAPDLMVGNYEGVLSAGGGSRRCSGGPGCFIFRAPPRRARTLRNSGFDVMNLANNHALDYGPSARTDTVRALERVGIEAAGLPDQVLVRHVSDTRVAIVGISAYAGTTSIRDLTAVRSLVRRAARAADVVVVCMHVGLEGPAGAHVPRGSDAGSPTRAAAHAAVAAGADIVLGSGPHVVRGVERVRGRLVVYSSGNFAGWNNFALGGPRSDSGVVTATFDHTGRTLAARWHGVRIAQPGVPMPDRSGSVVRRVASLSRQDFGRSAARFTSHGAIR